MYFYFCGTVQSVCGMVEFLHPRRVTKSYCLEVRLDDKEDETNLGAART